jgi:hypothetical protein
MFLNAIGIVSNKERSTNPPVADEDGALLSI